MATSSNILAWRIPWTEEPGGLQSMGCKESDTTEQLSTAWHVAEVHLPDHAGESPLLSRSGGEKGLRGSGAGM